MSGRPTRTAAAWTHEAIIDLLARNDLAVERAILRIYERQTATEKRMQETCENNGVGFSGVDGEIFSSFAEQIMRSSRPPGRRLSPKQLVVARKPDKHGMPRIARYAGQLLKML